MYIVVVRNARPRLPAHNNTKSHRTGCGARERRHAPDTQVARPASHSSHPTRRQNCTSGCCLRRRFTSDRGGHANGARRCAPETPTLGFASALHTTDTTPAHSTTFVWRLRQKTRWQRHYSARTWSAGRNSATVLGGAASLLGILSLRRGV
jgi:hypothetical protein